MIAHSNRHELAIGAAIAVAVVVAIHFGLRWLFRLLF